MKRILSLVRRCTEDYNMILPGDRIAVGVSGGKDSLLLLRALAEMRRFYPHPYELEAITLDMGFPNMDFSAVERFCQDLQVPYSVIKTDIASVVFSIREESNPCSLCAKMRRGALHNAALERGCKKVALGHHYDDVVETFFLSLFYEGRVSCFSPVSYLDRKQITLIRPMLYVPEKMVIGIQNKEALPVVSSTCPADGNTKRQYIKEVLHNLEQENSGLRDRIFGAVQRSFIDGWNEKSPYKNRMEDKDESKKSSHSCSGFGNQIFACYKSTTKRNASYRG